jgi:prevent-host-death family protein
MVVKSISAAKAQLSALIQRVRDGEDVIIGKAGRPVALLTKYSSSGHARKPGTLKGKIRIADNFDELPRDIAVALGALSEGDDAYNTVKKKAKP